MEHVVLAFYIVALVSGPAGIVLMVLLQKREPSRALTLFMTSWVGLSIVLLANSVEYYGSRIAGIHDTRAGFVAMLIVFSATILATYAIHRLSFELTRRAHNQKIRALFFAAATLAYVTALVLALFSPAGDGRLRFDLGYLSSTSFAALVILESAMRLIRYRNRIPATARVQAAWYGAVMLVLAILAVLNDAGHFGRWFGVDSIAMSPAFFLTGNVIVIARVVSRLSQVYGKEASGTTESRNGTADAANDDAVGHAHGAASGASSAPGDASRDAAIETAVRRWDLSAREREVLVLLLNGKRSHEIAETLFISAYTVKNHLHSIYKKSGASDRFQLARLIDSR